ncbi:uncharacterized protein LOC117477463 isoform X2 [Trematomus bernacchii]|uniref:uncharacterized protein LOC117477463 isoform X2 n=1 Tax=Trematomus bernacchii TaxID=40690 RepID=UPI00146A5B6C|nr:uncharacterized protein LOC117477463 isoform X2 [Trematomus bernacchii]
MESLMEKIATGKMSAYAVIIFIFTYNILLDRDFACTCKPQVLTCNLYMSLPPFIILFLILLADSSFQSVCKYHSSHCKCLCGLCWFYVQHILRAFLVGLLWVAFLFLDGDWYVCCLNDGSEQQAKLACVDKRNITVNDKVLKSELKNKSRAIGGGILFGIVLVAFVLPLCVRWTCWGKKTEFFFNKRFLYNKLIIIEEGNVLKEVLRESTKEKLTEGIQSNIHAQQWEECFKVARGLIVDDPPEVPGGSTDQREQGGEVQGGEVQGVAVQDDAVQDDAVQGVAVQDDAGESMPLLSLSTRAYN